MPVAATGGWTSRTYGCLVGLTLADIPTALAALDPPRAGHEPPRYGSIEWCTYGDHSCFVNGTYGAVPAAARWYEVEADIGVQGRGWPSADMPGIKYTRLPKKAQGIVDSRVWSLAQASSGLKARFSTPARDLYVRWSLESYAHSDWLWPADGHSGVDLYIEDEGLAASGVHQRWATSSGNAPTMQRHDATKGLYSGLFAIPPLAGGGSRNFTLYLPLGATVTSIAVAPLIDGAPAPLIPLPPPHNISLPGSNKPVLFYGTSIMQGAAASRPGLGWPQQAERMLGMDGVNLGFSGNGQMQPYWPTSGLLNEIDASIVVVDCEFNMGDHVLSPVEVYNRTVAFIAALKAAKPAVPVLLLEGHDHGRAWINPDIAETQNNTREAYRRAYNALLLAQNIPGVFYGQGAGKLGGPLATDFEAQIATCAGVHPTSLGHKHMALY
eukprot:gene3468-3934_t